MMDISLHSTYLTVENEEGSLNIMLYNRGLLLETNPGKTSFVVRDNGNRINYKIYMAFKAFMAEMMGNYYFNNDLQNDKIKVDRDNCSIVIKTDFYQDDYLRLIYDELKRTVTIELILAEKYKQNRVFLDFNRILSGSYFLPCSRLVNTLIGIKNRSMAMPLISVGLKRA